MLRFVRQVRDELTKVTWPNRQEVIHMTTLVIVISCIIGLYIGALDLALAKAMEIIIQ